MHDGEMTLKEHWKMVKLLKDRYMQLSHYKRTKLCAWFGWH